MAYGTVPVVHAVGGLRDTVVSTTYPQLALPDRRVLPPLGARMSFIARPPEAEPRDGGLERHLMCRPHLSPDVQTPFNPHDNTGTGWTFDFADGGAFRGAVHNALQTYR